MQTKSKSWYDRTVRGSHLSPGDRVLVRNMTPREGPGKLRSFWEDKVHVVLKHMGKGAPVYEVKPEDGTGRTRVLHRNLLLPFDGLPVPKPLAKKTKGFEETGCWKAAATSVTFLDFGRRF